MGNRLLQVLVICLAGVSLGLYGFRKRGPKGQRLRFDATGSATAAGLVQQGGDRDCYVHWAEAGQSVSIAVESPGQAVVFHVRLPGPGTDFLPGAARRDRAVSWQGTLPCAGLYQIVVEPRRGNTPYALRVTKRDPQERET
jgi:hypothetical protein